MYPPNPVTGYTSLEWCTRALTDEAFAVELSPVPMPTVEVTMTVHDNARASMK
jgi:hypothetical protein